MQWEILIVVILAIGIGISIKDALNKHSCRKRSEDALSEKHDADKVDE